MTSKDFTKKCDEILKKFNAKKDENDYYIVDTIFGELSVKLSPSPRIKLYSIYMRFKELEKFDCKKFEAVFSKYENISMYTRKWNIHNTDPNYTIEKMEERISNLDWLKNPENLELTLKS